METLKVDPKTAARMGYEDIRGTFATRDGFTEMALVGPASPFGTWTVVVHHGCDPDDPSAGTSGVESFTDEAAAVRCFRDLVRGHAIAQSSDKALAEALRRSIEDGVALPIPALEAIAARLEKSPSVFFTVSGGVGEVTAVDGTVQVYHVDLDKEGESLTDEDIDSLLQPFEASGTAEDVARAAEASREALARYKDDPAP